MTETDFLNQYNKVNFKHPAKSGFISVIIPVYKDYEGLQDTLESLMHQTLDNDNFEIIVVNDGSSKQIQDVCNKFNVKTVQISPNKGPANARNKGIEESNGEFIAFIDADMKAIKTWLYTGLHALMDSADYIGGKMVIDEKKVKSIADYYDFKVAFAVKACFFNKHFCPTANLFVKRKLIEKVGGFDIRLITSEDIEFGNRVYLNNFKQLFLDSSTIAAIHPPRGKGLLSRQKSYAEGSALLPHLFPKRFKKNILEYISLIITPPIKQTKHLSSDQLKSFSDKLKLFLFIWLFRITRNYHKLKYSMLRSSYTMNPKK